MSQLLLIRADAGQKIGTGHVMRCLALAQAWQDAGGDVTFATVRPAPRILERLQASGVQSIEMSFEPGGPSDLAELRRIATQANAAWVVVDGYAFDETYQRQLKEAGLRLLFIDDYGQANHHWADIVLNQNLGAKAALYESREPYTQLLMGHRYVMLRREFLKWRDWQRAIPEKAQRILITLGGSDPDNVTLKVVRALQELDVRPLEATVVIGIGNPQQAALEAALRDARFPIRMIHDAPNMAELMAEADLAIAAGGTTAWELAFMGLPCLLVALAANQVSNVEQLNSFIAARNLGWHEAVTSARVTPPLAALLRDDAARLEMSRRGRTLIDGQGAFRVCLHLNEGRVTLRPVNEGDCRQLWEWANEPEIRKASFSSESILWERHVEWFHTKLAQPQCRFWLAMSEEGQPIGQVRFDAGEEEGTAVISTSLDAASRGQGLGVLLIWKACRKILAEMPVQRVQAWVKLDNAASRRAFEKAEFKFVGKHLIKSQPALLYELLRAPVSQ